MYEPAGFIEATLRNDGVVMEIVWGFEAGGVAPGLNTRRLSPWRAEAVLWQVVGKGIDGA